MWEKRLFSLGSRMLEPESLAQLGAKAGGPGCELYPGGGGAINCWLVEYQALAELFVQTGSDSCVPQQIAEFVRKYHSPGICSAIHISVCVCVCV